MAKYRKRPVVIEAFLYTGGVENFLELTRWARFSSANPRDLVLDEDSAGMPAFVRTPEGNMLIKPGTWVICGVAGELYPCKPDIFEATYDGPLPDAGERKESGND